MTQSAQTEGPRGKTVLGFPLAGFRCAIDSAERLALARQAVADGGCRVKPLIP